MSISRKNLSNAAIVKEAFDTLSEIKELRKKWISFDVWSKLIKDYTEVNELSNADLNLSYIYITQVNHARIC